MLSEEQMAEAKRRALEENMQDPEFRRGWDRVEDLRRRAEGYDAAVAERDALKAAIRAALEIYATHHETSHPTRLHDPSCAGCRIGLTLSRLRPAESDSREEIQARIAALAVPESNEDAEGDARWRRDEKEIDGGFTGSEFPRLWPPRWHLAPETTPDAPTGGED
jgi:hypothetical protein